MLAVAGLIATKYSVNELIEHEIKEELYNRLAHTIALVQPGIVLDEEAFFRNPPALETSQVVLDSVSALRTKWPRPVLIIPAPDSLTTDPLPSYSTTADWDSIDGIPIVWTHLTFPIRVDDKWMLMVATESDYEFHELATVLMLASVGVFVALLITQTLLVTVGQRHLWRPFMQTLKAIRRFDVNSQQQVEFPTTRIQEFAELQDTVKLLMDRIQSEYTRIKQFSENSSHEMKTPLAIMQSELEMLLHSEGLTEAQMQHITGIQAALRRLTKLQSGLLTLARIEAGQFTSEGTFDFCELVKAHLALYRERLEDKGITLKIQVKCPTTVKAKETLADLIIATLLDNVLRHANADSLFEIHLDGKKLVLINEGPKLQTNPESLFERYKKGNPETTNTGLGLSIAQAAASANGWRIAYAHIGNQHSLTLSFDSSDSLQNHA